ncbi:MAG: MBL fold metallo-hydrolase [Methanophagales archaeon]|nr:MBL fold metallo-hydrolase [Methanophagales archaeon]RLG34294.1 MAG: MBL fold metallo-hydrolase [Methanosarcinales archaeon]
MEKIIIEPVWFDSLGAKSSCTLVKTPDVKILIDPGIAAMQPSFPASAEKKREWHEEGRKAIKRASKEADIIIISHYHYDHYFPTDLGIYKDKIILAKNPNEYINDSQRARATSFYSGICEAYGKTNLESLLKTKRGGKKYPDPLADLPIARHKNFGDYNKRRAELLEKGKRWFDGRVANWLKNQEIPELNFPSLKTIYPESKEFKVGKTRLRFSNAMFHGIEFSRVGWVFYTIVEHETEKFIHSSDLNGPVIEDYAQQIISENPQVLILDGPMTYMFGYLLNRINLNRAVENAAEIVRSIDAELILYDHHLPRERKFRERTEKVWNAAKEEKKKVMTAAEFLGKEPVVLSAYRVAE